MIYYLQHIKIKTIIILAICTMLCWQLAKADKNEYKELTMNINIDDSFIVVDKLCKEDFNEFYHRLKKDHKNQALKIKHIIDSLKNYSPHTYFGEKLHEDYSTFNDAILFYEEIVLKEKINKQDKFNLLMDYFLLNCCYNNLQSRWSIFPGICFHDSTTTSLYKNATTFKEVVDGGYHNFSLFTYFETLHLSKNGGKLAKGFDYNGFYFYELPIETVEDLFKQINVIEDKNFELKSFQNILKFVLEHNKQYQLLYINDDRPF